MALLKLVYLVSKNIEKKWTSPLQNWSLTVQQLYIKFGNRITLDLTVPDNGSVAAPGAHCDSGHQHKEQNGISKAQGKEAVQGKGGH
ncbi:hypothetical protein [Maribacter sp. 2307ULW6-5]|uniref:hypothetical protein n=1 Tax=Maribacter sp. 2307ULW6-5 TaxID=3386275 RepID=UPI0039BD5760